jgi:drug/metabolite transporter (DMT)-like permease
MLRGIFGCGGNIAACTALKFIPLAKATVIINTNPIFVAIFGYIILKERISVYDMGGISVTFLGVIVFLMDSFGANYDADFLTDLLGSFSAFCCSLFTAGAVLSIRKVGGRAHILMLGFSWAIWNSILSPLLIY